MIEMFDSTDPGVAILAWALTYIVSLLIKDRAKLEKIRHLLPFVALISAVFFRGLIDSLNGEALSWSTLVRGLAAAGVAVLSHSQIRELLKVWVNTVPKGEPGEEG